MGTAVGGGLALRSAPRRKPTLSPSQRREPGSRGWHRAGLRRIRHTVSSLRRELASERIIALGLVLTRGFHYPVAHWIPEPRAVHPTLGGHAIAIVDSVDVAT